MANKLLSQINKNVLGLWEKNDKYLTAAISQSVNSMELLLQWLVMQKTNSSITINIHNSQR